MWKTAAVALVSMGSTCTTHVNTPPAHPCDPLTGDGVSFTQPATLAPTPTSTKAATFPPFFLTANGSNRARVEGAQIAFQQSTCQVTFTGTLTSLDSHTAGVDLNGTKHQIVRAAFYGPDSGVDLLFPPMTLVDQDIPCATDAQPLTAQITLPTPCDASFTAFDHAEIDVTPAYWIPCATCP